MIKTVLLFSFLIWSTSVFSESQSATTVKQLKTHQLGNISPLHRSDQIYLAGQPVKEDFALARKAGVKTVLNLRTPSELNWDEGSYLKMLESFTSTFPFGRLIC